VRRFIRMNEQLNKSHNAVAPVSNDKLNLHWRNCKGNFFFIPMHVPEFVLKLMMGSGVRSVDIDGVVLKIQQAGFTFVPQSTAVSFKNLANEPAVNKH
jgi:NAD dependent epimerase/dehydratase family enzyme